MTVVIRAEFDTPKQTEGSLKSMDALRQGFSLLLDLIDAECPPDRYAALARTELESSAMWAIKSVAHNVGG